MKVTSYKYYYVNDLKWRWLIVQTTVIESIQKWSPACWRWNRVAACQLTIFE